MGFFQDYAQLAQTKATTTPKSGGGTMTTANWWETPGLDPSQFGQPARVGIGGSNYRFQTPDLWYDYYQGLDPSQQEQLTYLDTPIADQPFTTETEDLDFTEDPEAIPPWIPQATDQLLDFFESRMSDDYTLFTPAMRGQISSMIGRELALGNRSAVESAARAGVWSGGIESQLRSDALGQAAGALGQAQAQMEMQDEQSRQWAAGQLQSFTMPAQAGYQNYLTNFAALGPQMANLASQGMFQGPDIGYEDPWSAWGAGFNLDMLQDEIAKAEEAGDITRAEQLMSLGSLISSGMDPVTAMLISIVGLSPAVLGE